MRVCHDPGRSGSILKTIHVNLVFFRNLTDKSNDVNFKVEQRERKRENRNRS